MRFYLWGPAGTGKTWLFDAFIRKVNLIDDAFRRQSSEPEFSLSVEDRMGAKQSRYTLESIATQDIDYQEFTVHREYLLGDENNKKKLACTHSHQFMMLDGPGDETTGQLALVANSEDNRAKVLAANEALIDSDYLIVCVERGNLNLDGLSEPTAQPDTTIQNNQNAGKHYVERLRELLNLSRKLDQQIIICFTKSDKYGGKVAGFDAALSRLFGQHGRQIGELLRQLSRTRREPPHFFVSAIGYHHNLAGKVVPNIDTAIGNLAQPERWNPEGVESPFFNVLNDAELRMLKNMALDKDKAGLLSRLGGKFMNDSFRKDLMAAYVNYDDMLRKLKVRVG